MKFNIAYPTTGAQKTIEVDDERKIRHFLDKRLSAEVDGEALGDQFKGYIFKIAGGFDKQGFSMKQGVLAPGRVRLLLGKNTSCYIPRRKGERKRKSVRGCIVSNEISALNLIIVKKGPEELPGLTDKYIPRRLGPKRASKIRKLFNLSKEDDVRKYVIRRELPPKAAKEGKEGEEKKETKAKTERKRTKAPKIQRLVTPVTLQRRRHRLALKKRASVKAKAAAADYAKLLAQRQKEARQSVISSRRRTSQKTESQKKDGAAKPAAAAPKAAAKGAAKPAAAAPKGDKPKAAATGAKAAAKPAAKTAEKKAAAKPAATTAAKPAAAKPAAAKPAAPKAAAAPKAQSPKQPKQAAKTAKK